MKQAKAAKKLLTRMLINNWGGISHQILEFNEYVNLFSGKSGSGKSTVMDAIQVVLYGSTSSNFLNKAADDAKNRRSVFSYLRGEQKDGTANREGMDFCTHLVLEIKDTGTKVTTCAGIVFEVRKDDTNIQSYQYFSHSGKFPEDEYLENGIPYTIDQLRALTEERKESSDNRGRGDVNRVYRSNYEYIDVLYNTILGDMRNRNRLMTMEKSAIALRMTNGTSQFIRDYMFPRSEGDAIAKFSKQLGDYQEIHEKILDLEHQICLLDEIHERHLELLKTQADKERLGALIRHLDVENNRIRLQVQEQSLVSLESQMDAARAKQKEIQTKQRQASDELVEVESDLKASDFGQKERELAEMENTIHLLCANSEQWRSIVQGLIRWDEEEGVTDYVSNFALQLIGKFRKREITEEICIQLRQRLKEVQDTIDEALSDLNSQKRDLSAQLKEKRELIEDMKNDKKSYGRDGKEVREAKNQLERALGNRYGRHVAVSVLADLFDITDEQWKDAIEGRMGQLKYSLVTAPEYAIEAARLFRQMKRFESVSLINTAALTKEKQQVKEGSLYEAVSAAEDYVDLCLRHYLGRIIKCFSVEELGKVREGVTPDCYSYSNFMFRHLRERDYKAYACIGTRISKAKLHEMEEEAAELEQTLAEIQIICNQLKASSEFEHLTQNPAQLCEWAQAPKQLELYYKKQEKLQREVKQLKEGNYISDLKKRQEVLRQVIDESGKELDEIQKQLVRFGEQKGRILREQENLKRLREELLLGFTVNSALKAEVEDALKQQSEAAYRKAVNGKLAFLNNKEEEQEIERNRARVRFARVYPRYELSGAERSNEKYEEILAEARNNYESKFKEEFNNQCNLVYYALRQNVIAKIHGEIKDAYRHARDINRLLSKIRFSDSVYQIDILPAENENGQFYEMLMAEELDSKVIDDLGFEGQMSLGEDEFYQNYEETIQRFIERFMPPKGESEQSASKHREQMEMYTDYRNYLAFRMYETNADENGNERKRAVDDMAGKDSGGEGQNPKYVALLAGFAMLYKPSNNRDSKIRLVLLDEAFSKMDKERSEVCLRFARELDLQLIVCVPDERLQSLIRNVDCVYGFCRRANRISMMHIDKGVYQRIMEGKENGEVEEISGGK